MRQTLQKHGPLALVMIGIVALGLMAAAPTGEARGGIAARIEAVRPGALRPDTVVGVRRGAARITVPADGKLNLRSGDEIFVLRAEGRLILRLFPSNATIEINAKTGQPRPGRPNYVVPPARGGGLPTVLAKLLGIAEGGADQGEGEYVDAMTRGGPAVHCFNQTGMSNEPTAFRIPSLTAAEPRVEAGRRAIYVAWQGGVPPFEVRLEQAADGAVLGEGHVADGCALRLPPIDLAPGRYRLTITDGAGVSLEENNLLLVGGAAPPAPEVFRDLNQPATVRALYYATWLQRQADQAWAFEALQKVASLDCADADVAGWLATQGGVACR